MNVLGDGSLSSNDLTAQKSLSPQGRLYVERGEKASLLLGLPAALSIITQRSCYLQPQELAGLAGHMGGVCPAVRRGPP